MLQDPKESQRPGLPKPDATQLAQQAAAMGLDKATEAASGKTKEALDKAKKAGQTAQQAMGYAGMARQAATAFKGNGQANESPAAGQGINPAGGRPGNAAAIAASQVFGVSHLTQLTVVVEGKQIKHYRHFQLSQSATGHHSFSLLLDHDSLGGPEDHQMEQAQKLMGKRILVTFAYKNIPSGPERDFIGVVTKVGYGREHGNRGHLVLSGHSPTILLDAAPHIQSFGGRQPVPLSRIAHSLLQEGLGDKYPFRVDPAFTDNLTYSCQYDETHYNYLARMAEAYGEQLFYDGNKVHFGKLPPPEKAITLTFGEDVEQVSIEMRARHVNRAMYGYNSSNHELLTTGQTAISHQSSLAKVAYSISEKTFQTPSLRMAPLRAMTSKNIETAQKGSTGSEATGVLITTGSTSVPFLYPGCLVDMNLRKPGSAERSYFTRLMITEISHSVDTLGNYSGHFAAIAEGTGYLPEPKFHNPIAEPQMATVTDNKDSQGRVQVKFDWQTGGTTTEWIRVMSPDAGGSAKVSKNRGFMAIPEVGDQVMVGFVHNHPDRPYVMGGLFHGKVGAGGGSGNNIKSLSSKSGHIVELNDGGGITVRDKTGNTIFVDGEGNISATSSTTNSTDVGEGQSKIMMDKNGVIEIFSTSKIVFTSQDIVLNAGRSIKMGTGPEPTTIIVDTKGNTFKLSSSKNEILGTGSWSGGNVFIN